MIVRIGKKGHLIGGGNGLYRSILFFFGNPVIKIFFFRDAPNKFFFSIRTTPPPQMINGRPLKKVGLCISNGILDDEEVMTLID